MTLKPLTENTAAEIAAAIPGILRDRADREDIRGWSDSASYRQYVALLRTGVAWVLDTNTVVARVTHSHADVWGGAVAEAIDTATQDYDIPRGHINEQPEFDGAYTFTLTCPCKGTHLDDLTN